MPKKIIHKHHHEPLSANPNKDALVSRLSKIKGQVEGIIKMIEKDDDCMNLINQCRAARGALFKVEGIILETHLKACLVDAVKMGNSEEMIDEILDIYKISGR